MSAITKLTNANARKNVKIRSPRRIAISLIVILLVINCYGILLVKSNILEKVGNISLIHRYVPLGKTVFFISYVFLGIHEYAGNVGRQDLVQKGILASSTLMYTPGAPKMLKFTTKIFCEETLCNEIPVKMELTN